MVVLNSQGDDNKVKGNICNAPMHNRDEDLRRKVLFGSYPDLDTVLWLKRLALDPCKQEASQEENLKLRDRILNVRKVMLMTNNDSPRRKRKLQQFLKDNEATATILASEKFTPQNYKKSDSYLVNSVNSSLSFNRKAGRNSRSSVSSLTSEDTFVAPTTAKYYSPLIDSDESVNGHPLTPENMNLQNLSLFDADDSAHSTYSSSLKEPDQLNHKRLPVPIGPRFQAYVPDWFEPVNKTICKGFGSDSENLRFLGSRVWPVKNKNTGTYSGKIGKGRPESCLCISPGSTECIKKHIAGRGIKLKSEIGPVFFTWKFDEMGLVVSNSWTLEEQQNFSLLRQKSLKDETKFWEQAFMFFQSKSKKSILSYYFNVFIPRRLSLLTKISLKKVDSDDDDDQANSQEGFKARSDGSPKSKDVKKRYLRH